MESFPQGKGSFGQYKLVAVRLALAARAHKLGNTYTFAFCLVAEEAFKFFGCQQGDPFAFHAYTLS